jgi:predicted 2-oxoglutarate/Fe(II)-dependent dioxygenase YbiX
MFVTQPRAAAIAAASGDSAPAIRGLTLDGVFYSLESQAGRPAAVLFLGRLPCARAIDIFRALQRHESDFAAREAEVVAVVDIRSAHIADFVFNTPAGARVVLCGSEFFGRWRFDDREPMLTMIDRAGRVVSTIDLADPTSAAEAALREIEAMPFEPARDDILPAPVLLVPQILDRDLCGELIAHFEASAHVRGGMASIDAQGNPIHKIDDAKKHRNDFVLEPSDPFLTRALSGLIIRCLPEVKKAFNVDACHTDRILLARYDDSGGFFRRHRDNAAASVAFRQFALSVNLNSDYEGGHLLFPEYNSHRYKPGAGAGVVFSCSLLHEAAPVTRGRRHVLLTFLHNAEAQARWLESTAGRR